jgi:signal transduction histidine kinase
MNRFLPRSLFGQMLVIMLLGLIVSYAIGAWIYSTDREAAVREVGGLSAAYRIANLTRLVEEAPADWRARIVATLSDRTFRVTLSDQRPDFVAGDDSGPVAEAIASYLSDRLGLDPSHRPLVVASEGSGVSPEAGMFPDHPPMTMMRGPGGMMGGWMGSMMHGWAKLGALAVAIPLSSGKWLTFNLALPEHVPSISYQLITAMLGATGILIAVAVLAAKQVTAPLRILAEAAHRLGKDVNAAPIPEVGTIETRQASHAFNEMQVRLRELIDNRTRLLAAISHDLRTPLTLLRLRAENATDAEDRERMLANIAEMDAMVGAILQYSRDEMTTEPVRRTDLTALIQSVVDDLADAGLDVIFSEAPPVLIDCRSSALRRAITNLVDNAVKYGHKAQVTLEVQAKYVAIAIEDDGPGIPEQELARVFQPFYRVEDSRNRDSGGVGLGLAIAQSLVQKSDGTLTLRNRPSGGLRAQILLPKTGLSLSRLDAFLQRS